MRKPLFVSLIVSFLLTACSLPAGMPSFLPTRVLKLPANFPPQIFSDQARSNSGRMAGVMVNAGNQDILATSMDGSSSPVMLTDSPANDYSPAWSPDGSKIAFVSERDNNPEIYVMNADGTGQTRLTQNAVADSFPAWSPDGNLIAFASNRDNNWEIYVMKSDGADQKRVTNNPAYDTFAVWSLDGQWLAYVSAPQQGADGEVLIIKPDGSGQMSYIDYAIPDKSVLPFDPQGKKKNCSAFKTQVEAQLFFIAAGGPLRDSHELDGNNGNGIACESLP